MPCNSFIPLSGAVKSLANPWGNGQLKPCGYNGHVEFNLREFRPEDFEVLWNIDQKCFIPGIAYSRAELSAYIRRHGSFTIVAEGKAPPTEKFRNETAVSFEKFGDMVGFIVTEANRRGVGHIISIDVLPTARRLGLGSKLLVAAEERLRAVPCRSVILETAVDNASAIAFYKRHQYHVAKIVPRYYSNGVDAFVLEKDLLARTE